MSIITKECPELPELTIRALVGAANYCTNAALGMAIAFLRGDETDKMRTRNANEGDVPTIDDYNEIQNAEAERKATAWHRWQQGLADPPKDGDENNVESDTAAKLRVIGELLGIRQCLDDLLVEAAAVRYQNHPVVKACPQDKLRNLFRGDRNWAFEVPRNFAEALDWRMTHEQSFDREKFLQLAALTNQPIELFEQRWLRQHNADKAFLLTHCDTLEEMADDLTRPVAPDTLEQAVDNLPAPMQYKIAAAMADAVEGHKNFVAATLVRGKMDRLGDFVFVDEYIKQLREYMDEQMKTNSRFRQEIEKYLDDGGTLPDIGGTKFRSKLKAVSPLMKVKAA